MASRSTLLFCLLAVTCYVPLGVPFFDAVFNVLDCAVNWTVGEGEFVQPVCEVATVTGKVRSFSITVALRRVPLILG